MFKLSSGDRIEKQHQIKGPLKTTNLSSLTKKKGSKKRHIKKHSVVVQGFPINKIITSSSIPLNNELDSQNLNAAFLDPL